MRNTLLSLTAGVACLAGSLTTATAQTIIVPVNQNWRWMDASSGTLCLDGTGWETTGYDDSAWGGPSPGGFTGGEDTPATLTSLAGLLGTTTLPAPPANSGSPAYFRTHFNPGPTNNLTLILSNRYDDQIIFYINGTRVGSFNAANPETCTISTASGGEATTWAVLTLTPAQLGGILQPNADNVLAVSVHQNATTSSDMVMVCAVSGSTAAPPTPGIPFGATGSTNFTFDAAPPAELWSTTAWSGGANGTADDFTAVDTRVQALTAAGINAALTSATGNPPAAGGTARYASDAGAQYILTRPTGTAGDVIMATLRNTSGSAVSALGINYTLTVVAPQVEEIPGHLVYYSLTGATPWTLIPEISNQPGEAVAGTYPKSAAVTLSSSWNPGTLLYILWADDNGSGTPDAALEIDNVQFTQLIATPPTFCNATTDPTNRTVVQCASTTLSAPLCAGFPTPTLQWFHGATAITGQTNSSYVIASMTSGDAGTYFLRAVNASGTSNSHTATITYQAAPAFALVRALANVTNPNEVTLTFNLAVDPVEGNDQFNYTIHEAGGADFNTSTAVLTNGTNIVLTTAEARQQGIDYTVTIGTLASVCPGTSITGTFPVFQAQPLLTYGQAWHYLDTDVDPGPTWNTAGFDDSGWKVGAGPFDAKKSGVGTPPFQGDANNCRPDTLYGLGAVGTCLSFSNATHAATSNCFFRTHFHYSGNPATNLFLFHGKFDDEAVVYLNGTELERVGIPATATLIRTGYGETNYVGARGVGDNDAQDSALFLAPAGLINGDNLIAVQLYQGNAGSSDITMGLEIDEVLSKVHPKLSIVNDTFGGVTITWGGAGILQSAPNVTGPWSDVPGASSGYNPLVNTARKFYRLR